MNGNIIKGDSFDWPIGSDFTPTVFDFSDAESGVKNDKFTADSMKLFLLKLLPPGNTAFEKTLLGK